MLNKFKKKLFLIVISLVTALHVSATDRIVLAELIFPNGNQMSFGQLPESGEMYIEEHVELGDGEVFILDRLKGDLLDKYLQVTPPGTPVPRQLIEFTQENEIDDLLLIEDEDQNNDTSMLSKGGSDEISSHEKSVTDKRAEALKGRELVGALDVEVFVDWDDLSELAIDTKAAGTGSCNNSTGYQYFEAHHCNLSGSHGSGSSQTYCDYPMQFGSYQRTSSNRMRSTYSRVVNCGGGDVAVVHSKKTGGFWYEQGTWFIGVDRARGTETWAGKNSIRKKRRINVLPVTPGGYIRAWTKFTRNSK